MIVPLIVRQRPQLLIVPNIPLESVCFLHTHLPKPNSNPLISLLETKCKTMKQLKQIQAQMILTQLILHPFASSRLIAFSATSQSSGSLHYSTHILNNTQNPNIFSYNIAIRAHSHTPKPHLSIFLYKQMLQIGTLRPDHFTFPFLLKASAHLSLIKTGSQIHNHVLRLGFASDIFIHNGLLHFLVSCGEVQSARLLFDQSCVRDLVSWNSIINGYGRSGRPREALEIFQQMVQGNVTPDEVTLIGVVSSCTQLQDLRLGRDLHRYVGKYELKLTVPLSNALMDMYVKCGSLEEAEELFNYMNNRSMVSWTTMLGGYAKFGFLDAARKLFNEMPEKDVVTWNAMISAYMQSKRGKDVLSLFYEMQAKNVRPDEVTLATLLSACSQLGALEIGEWIHRYVEKQRVPLTFALGTVLVDMYAKCGNISNALQVFQNLPQRNALTWTVIISGLALHGHAHDAISYFLDMIAIGLIPDEVTFLGVLSACCHAGMVDEGRHFFSQMRSNFNISPNIKHYSCMVDLLGRAGLLEEAEQLTRGMPMEPDAVVMGTLFFACRRCGNIEVGERVASKLFDLDPLDSGNYVMLANMYLEANMPDRAEMVRRTMKEKGLDKAPGCSSIELNGNVFEFVVRDKSHPESKEIYRCLVKLTKQLQFLN